MSATKRCMLSAAAVCLAGAAQAQPFCPATTNAGGVNPYPEITAVTNVGGRTYVSWTGFKGGYTLQVTTNGGAAWSTVGYTNSTSKMLSFKCPAGTPSNGTFQIVSPVPHNNSVYGSCATCHAKIARKWAQTPHADAFSCLVDEGEQTNSACLPCHTVGYGLPATARVMNTTNGLVTNIVYNGFVSTNVTPWFKGVQCENCHGPTGGHAGKQNTPAVTLDSKMCGGCHNSAFGPQYADEWRTSWHGKTDAPYVFVDEDGVTQTNGLMRSASSYLSATRATRDAQEGRCGLCHSAVVRTALKGMYPKLSYSVANGLPDGTNCVRVGIGCIACHDPHNEHVENGGMHLVAPLYSTNGALSYDAPDAVITYTGYGTNRMGAYGSNAVTNWMIAYTNFMYTYKPQTMVCGQCHQGRWTLPGATNILNAAPHPSIQYNMNAANFGALSTNVPMPDRTGALATSMRHGVNTNGESCTMCHMVKTEEGSGHSFEVNTNGCFQSGYCHDTGDDMEAKIVATQADISNRVWVVKGLLDAWGASSLPSALAITNFPTRGGTIQTVKWEYSSVGPISALPSGGGVTNVGASASQQNVIPWPIREARLNLYLVWRDLSIGVHNAEWARYLIDVASNKVSGVTD